MGKLLQLEELYVRIIIPIIIWMSELIFYCIRYLNNNALTGSIPPELGQLTKLQFLWVKNIHLFVLWRIVSDLGPDGSEEIDFMARYQRNLATWFICSSCKEFDGGGNQIAESHQTDSCSQDVEPQSIGRLHS